MSEPLTALSNNLHQWRIGESCRDAARAPAGDLIDRGLILLAKLNEAGYDIVPRVPDIPGVGPALRLK